MLDDDDRLALKRDMLLALGDPSTHVSKPCTSREQALELIRLGEADVHVSMLQTAKPAQHFAVRFNDRTLGDSARDDCLDLYQLRRR